MYAAQCRVDPTAVHREGDDTLPLVGPFGGASVHAAAPMKISVTPTSQSCRTSTSCSLRIAGSRSMIGAPHSGRLSSVRPLHRGSKAIANPFGRIANRVLSHVRIARGRSRLPVTEERSDQVQREPRTRRAASVRVTEIVKPHAAEFRAFANSVPRLGQVYERLRRIAARDDPGRSSSDTIQHRYRRSPVRFRPSAPSFQLLTGSRRSEWTPSSPRGAESRATIGPRRA